MKPAFALSLSQEGIVLLHRTSAGWMRVGEVDPEKPGLAEAMGYLRRTITGLATQGFQTKILLPESQILYLDIEAPGPDRATRRAQIARALEGRTPYPVQDLVFDWSGDGPVVQVAVVARVTLDEAEAFAEEHRFHPVSFVASPADDRFAGEPFFGSTGRMLAHFPPGEKLERDSEPVRPVARAAYAAEAPGPVPDEDEAPFVALTDEDGDEAGVADEVADGDTHGDTHGELTLAGGLAQVQAEAGAATDLAFVAEAGATPASDAGDGVAGHEATAGVVSPEPVAVAWAAVAPAADAAAEDVVAEAAQKPDGEDAAASVRDLTNGNSVAGIGTLSGDVAAAAADVAGDTAAPDTRKAMAAKEAGADRFDEPRSDEGDVALAGTLAEGAPREGGQSDAEGTALADDAPAPPEPAGADEAAAEAAPGDAGGDGRGALAPQGGTSPGPSVAAPGVPPTSLDPAIGPPAAFATRRALGGVRKPGAGGAPGSRFEPVLSAPRSQRNRIPLAPPMPGAADAPGTDLRADLRAGLPGVGVVPPTSPGSTEHEEAGPLVPRIGAAAIDLPEGPAPVITAVPLDGTAPSGSRKKPVLAAKSAASGPVGRATLIKMLGRRSATANTSPKPLRRKKKAPEAEASELTVFGARRTAGTARSGRMGLVLTLALVALMGAVALWSKFSDSGTGDARLASAPAQDAAVTPEAAGGADEALAPDASTATDAVTESPDAADVPADTAASGAEASGSDTSVGTGEPAAPPAGEAVAAGAGPASTDADVAPVDAAPVDAAPVDTAPAVTASEPDVDAEATAAAVAAAAAVARSAAEAAEAAPPVTSAPAPVPDTLSRYATDGVWTETPTAAAEPAPDADGAPSVASAPSAPDVEVGGLPDAGAIASDPAPDAQPLPVPFASLVRIGPDG